MMCVAKGGDKEGGVLVRLSQRGKAMQRTMLEDLSHRREELHVPHSGTQTHDITA